MKTYLTLFHRWVGLSIAVFLFISGATGAIISWDHELDEAVNPEFFFSSSAPESPHYTPLELANIFEQAHPNMRVSFMPLQLEEGHALTASVTATTKKAEENAHYNQLAINPVTTEIQAKRMWGEISLSRENILPFLYKLHYSMHLPDIGSVEFGMVFMGIIAIAWVIDCFVALIISFPTLRSWKKSFRFRLKNGGYKRTFDLHRSGGVWAWLLLLLVAISSVSMNLHNSVVRPLVSMVSTLSPDPFASRELTPFATPKKTREDIVSIATSKASELNIYDPAGGIFYSRDFDVYGVGFYELGKGHGDGGLGNPWLYFDGKTGEFVGSRIPGTGSAGDIFIHAQFPIHSGRILGLPGRILISLLGVVVAMLSVTGIIIWAKKRKARKLSAQNSLLKNNTLSEKNGSPAHSS